MFGYGFFKKKDDRPIECDAPSLIGCSTAASLADGALVGGALSAVGKSAMVAVGGGAVTCGLSAMALMSCGFIFCYNKPQQQQEMHGFLNEEDPLLGEDKPTGAIDFTPPSAHK